MVFRLGADQLLEEDLGDQLGGWPSVEMMMGPAILFDDMVDPFAACGAAPVPPAEFLVRLAHHEAAAAVAAHWSACAFRSA